MDCSGTFTSMVGQFWLKRFTRLLGLLFVVAGYLSFSFQNAFAASGITYTGRIVKGDEPLDNGIVRFDVWIKTKDNCVLYYERRNLDMTGSGGTYSFEIGDANIIPGSQSFPQSGIQTISDIFNNNKSRANGDVDGSLQCATFNPASDEGRLMTVSFTPAGETAQALPDLAITAVPTSFRAFNADKINGYGTGDLLKVDSAVNKTTYANNALTQAQYDEFWKLILGTSTTYLKSIPTLGGDVTGTLPAVTVTKIQNVAVTAPTTGDTGKVLTYNGTGMVWSAAAGGGITTLNGLSATTQSFVSGTTPLTISSSGSAHTFNITNASSSASGLLTQADWNAFNSKQSGALASGQVWIGNASGAAQAQTLSGDATVSASGVVTVDKTQSAAASKILQLDVSGNAYVAGVDIKGTGTGEAQLRFTGSTDMVLNLPTTSGSANQFLQTDGNGTLTWASQSAMLPAITAGQVWVGNASNGAQAFTLSGDIASVSNTGLVTLSTSATGSNKLPLAGGTMSGAIAMGGNNITNAGDVSLGAGKFLGLGAGSTEGTVAGQVWYDSGVIKYFDGTTARTLGVSGSGITSLNGLTSGTQSFVNGTSGNSPAFSSAGSAHTLNIPMASASGSVTAGLISNADYTAFNSKMTNALPAGQMWVGNASGVAQAFTLSGDVSSVSSTGAVTVNKTILGLPNKLLQLDNTGIANNYGVGIYGATSGQIFLSAMPVTTMYGLRFPGTAPGDNQILKSNSSGDLTWVPYLGQVSDSASLTSGKMWIGNASGVASEVAMSGDATISNAGLLTLKSVGTAGTYSKVVTDAQGRVTSGSALASGDVTAALGYTPASSGSVGYVNGGNAFAGNATIGLSDNYNLGFKTNNNTQMTLTSSGNLGIGTTSPISKLQIGTANANTDYGTSFLISGSAGCSNCAGSARVLLEDRNASATTMAALTYGGNNFSVGSLNTAGSVWNNSAILNINTATDVSTFSGVLNTQNVNIANGKFLGLGAGSTAGTVAGQMWYDSGVIKYFDGSTTQSLGVAGAGITSLNGLTSNTQSFVMGTSGNAPAFSSAGSAHTLNIPMASASSVTAGLISNADYASMMAKQSGSLAAGQMWVGNASGVAQAFALSGDVSSVSNSGLVTVNKTTTGANNTILSLDGSGVANVYGVGVKGATSGTVTLQAATTTANYSLKLPSTTPFANQVMQSDASGNLSWATALTSSSGFVNGGNSFGSTANLGTNDNNDLNIKTNNATRFSFLKTGEVGISPTAGGASFQVNNGGMEISRDDSWPEFTVSGYGNSGGNYWTPHINLTYARGTKSLPTYAQSGDTLGAIRSSNHTNGLGAFIRFDATQNHTASVSGTKLSFVTVPNGNNIGNVAMSLAQDGKVGIGSSAPAYALDMQDWTDAIRLPAGNTSQQPSNAAGLIRYNTTNSNIEFNNGSGWSALSTGSGAGYVNGGNSFAGNASIGLNDNYNLLIKTNNTSRMAVMADGKVGIATASPKGNLHIADTAATGASYSPLVIGNASGTHVGIDFDTVQAYNNNSNSTLYLNYWGGDVGFGDGGTMKFDRTNNKLYLNNGGNIEVAGTGAITTLNGSISSTYGNIYTTSGKIGAGGTPTYSIDAGTNTDALRLPRGTDAQRPANAAGLVRYNTTSNNVEFNNGSGWSVLATSSGASGAFVNGGNSFGSAPSLGTNDNFGMTLKTNGTTAVMIDSSQNMSTAGDVTMVSGKSLMFGTSAYSFVNGTGGASSYLNFGTSGAIVMTLDVNGRVGIGTNPQFSLDLGSRTDSIRLPAGTDAQRPANTAGQLRYNTTSNSVEFNNGSTWTALGTGSGGTLPSISSAQVWVGNSSGGAQARTLSGDVTIDNTGLVSLKSTGTAGTYFKVVTDAHGRVTSGSALASGDVVTALGFTPSSGGAGYVSGGNTYGANATIGLNDNYNLGFRTNNTTQMTLSNGGNLGVGITSPAAKIHVKGSAPTSVTIANEYLHLGGTEQNVGGYQVIGFGYYASEAYPNAYMGMVQTSVAGSGKGDLVFGARNSTVDSAPSELMRINSAGGVGIGTSTINNNLSFSGQAAQKIGVERITTSGTAGADFTITAGGAYSGGTNLAGGTLTLASGTATGTGGSQILLQTATSGTTGTTDRAPATKVTISGTANSDTMAVAGTIRGTSVDNSSSTTIDWSKGNTQYTAAGCTGTQYTFSNMRDGGVYTLAITGTFTANCTFGQTSPDTLSGTPGSGAFYFLPANSVPSGSNAIFSFMRVGTKVYVQWNSGFQN